MSAFAETAAEPKAGPVDWTLYVVTDSRLVAPQSLAEVVSAAIRGLASATMEKDAAPSVGLLRTYHGGVSEAILTQGGLIGSASGDAIVAYFGALGDGADPRDVRRSVRAAQRQAHAAQTPPPKTLAMGLRAAALSYLLVSLFLSLRQ
jgi:class 3 adenylate cyclase